MTEQLKAIDFKILPIDKTYFGVLGEATGRKQRIKDYIDGLAKKYPATQARITQFWTDNQAEYDKLKGIDTLQHFKEFFNKFNIEDDIKEIVKTEVLKEIDGLFTAQTGDIEILTAFKEVYKDHKDYLPDFIDNNSQGGVCWTIFLTELLKDFYLIKAPKYINEILSDNNIKISELEADAWKKARSKLLENAYSTFTDTEQETYLNELTEKLDTEIDNIEALIVKVRKTKESNAQDDINDLKDQIKNLTADKQKLTEEKKEIIKLGGEAMAKITGLEAERDQLKKDLADEKAKKPAAGTGTTGTQTGPIPIPGSDEWKAVALFLTEPDFYKAQDLFNELYNGKWTAGQRQAIYNMLKANKENNSRYKAQWVSRFLH